MKNRSILYKWFISYSTLMLVPITSIFVIFYTNIKAIEKEYEHYYVTSLNNVCDNFDIKLNNLKSFYNYISLNEYYKRIMITTKQTDNLSYISYHLFNDLSLYQNTNHSLGWFIYSSKLDEVVTSNNFPFRSNAENMVNKFFLSCGNNGTFYLVYANSIRSGVNGRIHNYVSLNSSDLQSTIHNIPEGVFLIISDAETYMWFNQTNAVQGNSDIFSVDTQGNVSIHSDYMYVSDHSEISDFTYYFVVNKSIFYDKKAPIRNAFIFNLATTILLSIILITYLTKINYKPLNELLSKHSVPNIYKNEYSNLDSFYNVLNEEVHSLQSQVNMHKTILQSTWLLSVIKGRTSKQELIKQSAVYDISYSSHYGLLGIYINPNNYNMNTNNAVYFLTVDQILCDLFNTFSYYKVEDGYFIYYLFSLEDQIESQWYEIALKNAENLYSSVNTRFTLDMTIIVGSIANDLYDTNLSYNEIKELIALHHLYEGTNVIDIRDYIVLLNEKHSTNAIADYLHNAIKNGDIEDIDNYAVIFIKSLEGQPFNVQKLYIYNSFSSIVRLFDIYSSNNQNKIILLQHIEPIMNSSTSEQLKTSFNNALTYVCQMISSTSHAENNIIIDKIKQYIVSHYRDTNLCVNSIADDLGKSQKYLSRIFKEHTGIGILEYINTFRITKAVEIATTSEELYNIDTLSLMVGYSNTQAFRRSFIKVYGVAPSIYFKSHIE